MVDFPSKPAKPVEEQELPVQEEDLKVKAFKDTIDFPSIDSFLDFDSCNWFGSNRNTEEFSIEDKDFDFFEDDMDMSLENQSTVMSESLGVSMASSESVVEVKKELCGVVSEESKVDPKLCEDMSAGFDGVAEAEVKEKELVASDNTMSLDEPKLNSKVDEGSMEAEAFSVVSPTMGFDESKLKKADEGLACSIEVGLEKVSLKMDDEEKSDGTKGKSDSGESDSETSSSSSSSGDSSSSDEEGSDEEESDEEETEKEKKDQMVIGKKDDVAGEREEGEIESADEEIEVEDDDDDDDDDDEVNEMVAWSNDEDEDFGLQTKEPIRSKNELTEFPPVPAVDVTLEPHHVTLPVGVISSVMSTQVIVEGMEKHNPLTEGSILWITERRTPLGLVDEIFGPVKCPYYIVRFNSESEVPEGIGQGTPVSFVADFAQHILNIKELQKKGYDASGDNDEEIPDELEFSDDEKEAEYRRLQKMEKRGMMNDNKPGNSRNKKKKNRDQGRPTGNNSGEWTENQGSSSLSSNHSDPQMGGPGPNHQPRPQMDGFAPNGGAWRPPNNQQIPHQRPPMPNQMGMPNLGPMQLPFMAMRNQNQMMFPPQFNGGQMPMPMPMPMLGGPGGLNFFPGLGSAPWPALVGQNGFNQQQFGMGRGIQHPQLPNELLNFNMFPPQGFQMNQPHPQMPRPQSSMNPQFQMQPQFQNHPQSPMNPQYQMLNHPPQSSINPQFQMPPQSETHPQPQVSQSPTNSQSPVQPQSQGFSSGQSSEEGRGHRGRGRGRGRGRFRGRGGRGRGRSK